MNTVWVLVIKHGRTFDDVDDIVVFDRYAAAWAGLYRYCMHWWGLSVGEDVPIPQDINAVIQQYFMFALPQGEEYTLVERPINR